MSYLPWALLALASYTFVGPLVSVATRQVPSDVAVLVTNTLLTGVAVALVVANDHRVVPHLTGPKGPYLVLAGVALTVGILSYYRALSLGPVSVVVPVFGMFVVTSSIVGIALLEESLTARKVAGIALAAAAVYLTSVE